MLAVWVAVLTLLVSVPALAQNGTVSGQVLDAETGDPLPFCNVIILGTTIGGISLDDGTFSIDAPSGSYQVQATYIGYDKQVLSVVVVPNQVVRVEFKLQPEAFEEDVIEVSAEKALIQRERSDSSHSVRAETFKQLPVDDVNEAIALKAGITSQGGELHFRGGRGGEVATYIDGVPVRDPLGQSGVNLSTVATQTAEVITGGFEAQFGNAQSGVINLETKEGGDQFAGEFRYYTDDYGAPDRTFNNFDRVSLGAGGPVSLPGYGKVTGLTYFLSYEGTFQDTYLKTSEIRNRNTLFDMISLGDRQNNDIKWQGKLAYKISPQTKITFEYLNNRQRWDSYNHRWSRNGYVDIAQSVDNEGDIVTEYGRFQTFRPDGVEGVDFIAFNAPQHTIDNTEIYQQYKMVWRHNISPNTFYNLRVSRSSFDTDRRVLGREPWEYVQERPGYWLDTINNTDHEVFFVTNGDFPRFYTRDNKVYTVKTDWTKKTGRHLVKWGAQGVYNDLRVNDLLYPNEENQLGTYGADLTTFHYYNPEGSLYLQDRWEHEGMVINAGLRYDVFSVGDQIAAGEVTDRVKTQLSPRLGVSFPISDRDVMSFNYGRYFQIPDRIYIFENRGILASVRGNPDLDAETTISYQFGIQHVFTPTVVGQFAVYFKDIFGLLTTRQLTAPGTPDVVWTYVNQDYASSRGFEASLTKRFSHNFSAEVAYTFGYATGVASDEEETLRSSEELLYLPISEQPLDWDQRHSLNTTLYISDPGNWSASFVWRYGSGFPFTPRQRLQKTIDPKDRNTGRLPSTSTLDVQGDKFYKIWGQEFTFFLQARNLLDAKNIRDLEPSNWPAGLSSSEDLIDYLAYYTETGQAGGAFLSDDRDGDGLADWEPLNDPRVYHEGRVVRVGVGVTF
jgi:outer membrane receptor for ferrienterochelin and colicin